MNWDRSCECGPSSNLKAIRHPDVSWILAGPCYLILGYLGMCGFWSQAVNIHWESQAQMQNSGHQQLSPLCVQWHHPGLETCSDLHHKLNSCSAKFLEIHFQPSPNTARNWLITNPKVICNAGSWRLTINLQRQVNIRSEKTKKLQYIRVI